MKCTSFMTKLAVLAVAFCMTGCNSVEKLQRDVIETAVVGYVNPQQLESVNGVVNFDYAVNFAPKEFDKRLILKISPKVQYGDQKMNLQPVFLQGKKVKGYGYPVVDYDKGSSYTWKMSFDFKEGMENGVLWAGIGATQKNRSFTMSPVVLNKNGIKVWRQPAFTLDGVDYVPAMTETFVEDVPAIGVGVVGGYVMFPLGKSAIPREEQNSAVMKQAAQAMKKVLADKNAEITHLFIYISNSPEGLERLNRNLAGNRFRSARNFFEKYLQLEGTPMAHQSDFVVRQTVAENWEGLYSLLENSNVKNKEQIIRKLKDSSTATARNKVLDSYIAKIPELKEVILPLLRRADFFVFYTVPETVQEDVQLTYFMPQLKEEIPAVTEYHNWQLLNDLAVMAINDKEYDKAKKLLEAAMVLEQDAAVNNNMGVVHARKGDTSGATQYFDRAKIRKEALYNMGLVLMQNGQYAKAIPYLKADPNVNLAYAQLMNNENRAAWDTFHRVKMQNAMDYYLKAVAAARLKNPQGMAVALEKAVRMQPDLKDWAATDISFYPYRGDPVFLQIVK